MDFSPTHSGYNVAKQDEIIPEIEQRSDPVNPNPDHLDPLFIYLITFTVIITVIVIGFVLFCKYAAHKIPYFNRPVSNTSEIRHGRHSNNHRHNRNNRHLKRISWISSTGETTNVVHGSPGASGSVNSTSSIISPSGNSFYLHSLSSDSSASSASSINSLSSYSLGAGGTVANNHY